MNANVISHNVASTSLTDGIIPYVHSTKQLRDSKLSFNDSTYVTSIASNVAISGNLIVDGNITAQHTTDHYITDKIFAVAHNNSVDAKDMGQHMGRPTANVFAGFLGQTMTKEYTIAYTTSKSESQTIIPSISTSDGYITANVWGNVLASNVISRGLVEGATLKGAGSAITALNMDNAGSGTLAVNRGGTGADTASAAASALGLGTEDQPSFVTVSANVDAGNVVTTTIELGHASDTTLARSSAGVVTIEGAEIRTGTVPIGKGGTGQTTASAAASALGLGTEDQPSFVTVSANVNASNIISQSIKLTDPGITASFSTDTIIVNAENRTYGTAPLIAATGDIDSLVFSNFIDGAQIVVPILASGGDRAVSKDLTNVNFTVITEDVSITQDKHALMSLSNIAGNVYMNTVAFS